MRKIQQYLQDLRQESWRHIKAEIPLMVLGVVLAVAGLVWFWPLMFAGIILIGVAAYVMTDWSLFS